MVGGTLLEISETWARTYPNAIVGLLVMEAVHNPTQHRQLEQKKAALEQSLRDRYSEHDRQRLRQLPVLSAYESYYRNFGQTYHVRHQLESIVLKGKGIPSVAALVEAMFMAELENLLLTAGHDLDRLATPISVGVAEGVERYIRINGKQQQLKAGDMYIRDQNGIISCILYGPDKRTRLQPATNRVAFTIYAPPGISEGQVQQHLESLRENVRVLSPESTVATMGLFSGQR